MSKVEQSRKTGGRAKGTPNKRTLDIQQRLDELKCDPIEGMARLAQDENASPELRGRMFSELAQYVAPKRKAVDLSGTLAAQPIRTISADISPQDAARAYAELISR